MKLKKKNTQHPKKFKKQGFISFASTKAQKTQIQILLHAAKAQKTCFQFFANLKSSKNINLIFCKLKNSENMNFILCKLRKGKKREFNFLQA